MWPANASPFGGPILKSIYRISSNKSPGRLFQIWVLRGALNRGGLLIRGGALNKKITRTHGLHMQVVIKLEQH